MPQPERHAFADDPPAESITEFPRPAAHAPRLAPLSVADFLSLDLPSRELLIAPWLPQKGLAMLYGPRGAGKTLFALTCAYALATGSDFLGFAVPQPRRCLYLDAEMPARTMQERLGALVRAFEALPPDPSYFRLLSGDLAEGGLPDLSSRDGRAEIDAVIGDVELIIVDNISTLVRTGKENEAESWLPVQEWSLAHRRAGRSILLVHHAGKGGLQRGTSRREDVLDTVIALRRPADYSADQGARFEVHYEKARGLYGDDARPFEARYEARNNTGVWTRTEVADVELQRVVDALNDGLSIRDAAEELGLHRSKVERLKRRATDAGLLNG